MGAFCEFCWGSGEALAQGWHSFPNKCTMCANMQGETGGPELAKELKDEEVHSCGLLETMFP